jgi:hypothetical protein
MRTSLAIGLTLSFLLISTIIAGIDKLPIILHYFVVSCITQFVASSLIECLVSLC